jgi:mono/diheme cytochrome c family protein
MGKSHILLLFFIAFILVSCATSYKKAYNYPEGMSGTNQEKLYRTLEMGRDLYSKNCASCHGTYNRKHDNTARFTTQQLNNYGSKFIFKDPENHAVAAQMEPEDLAALFLFLQLKKQNASGDKK